jgi:carbon storage regulator
MLVLSRRRGEKIVIDGRITVVVSQLKGGRVRIAIEAPPEVSILRGELQSRRDEESRIALSHVG